ncbi:hypothetical protein AB0G02_04565 [Actinosynnema sp. NPDC023658]|uniref:hypothetical protein n=1 Tax=Actinosynnema sp. NPDC023658 TaxID=3155465 RepID=UPI0033DD98C3
MTATPPGVDELDPARLDTDALELEFAGTDEVTDPQDLPPVSPDGQHQTHGDPVETAPAVTS